MANFFRKTARNATRGGSPILADREKLYVDEVIEMYPDGLEIDAFDLITNNKTGDQYAVIGIKDTNDYFNGGKVLTDIVRQWIDEYGGDIEAANEALRADGGLAMKLTKAVSRAGRQYTKVTIL